MESGIGTKSVQFGLQKSPKITISTLHGVHVAGCKVGRFVTRYMHAHTQTCTHIRHISTSMFATCDICGSDRNMALANE